jgi:hypothetical protein
LTEETPQTISVLGFESPKFSKMKAVLQMEKAVLPKFSPLVQVSQRLLLKQMEYEAYQPIVRVELMSEYG